MNGVGEIVDRRMKQAIESFEKVILDRIDSDIEDMMNGKTDAPSAGYSLLDNNITYGSSSVKDSTSWWKTNSEQNGIRME